VQKILKFFNYFIILTGNQHIIYMETRLRAGAYARTLLGWGSDNTSMELRRRIVWAPSTYCWRRIDVLPEKCRRVGVRV